MKKALFVLTAISLLAISCSSLTSRTFIKANESFVLGENLHGSYVVRLRNTAQKPLTITQTQLDGTVKSTLLARRNEWLTVQVAENTAVRIQNSSNESAEVDLKVVGDTNLSMGYKN